VLALTGLCAGAVPAVAAPAPGGTTVCLDRPTGSVPLYRRAADTPYVGPQAREAVDQQLDQTVASTTTSAKVAERDPSLPAGATIPTYVHIIKGRHRSDRRITWSQARQAIAILNAGFAGAEDPATMQPSGFRFVLVKMTVSRKDRWFHARPFSRADRQMKRRLHRGGAHSLNLYFNNARAGGLPLLGFSRFPWQYHARPRQDGVTINVESLPGGRASGYNLGDTVVHEVGHWLGLFHTFEGGCADGDGVADTPAEGQPSFYCEIGRNTCPDAPYVDPTPLDTTDDPPAPVDPVQNFMDYSYDSCMTHFTEGQRDRMMTAWVRYRAGR
jgi:hypothetical protein